MLDLQSGLEGITPGGGRGFVGNQILQSLPEAKRLAILACEPLRAAIKGAVNVAQARP
jgi:hypothetical protein